ncbi:hypothetical protein PBY51_007606 [Eleginops maclovinus]|uniref:RING-type E3 ubiquitin transferase n=1 Tax=Eleginops maclovinus TaxID=56733 RepID=A0AAN7X4A1_ELEMC|nr:hypothetical protein PBY51_007606 [Eleginops maclovinus]
MAEPGMTVRVSCLPVDIEDKRLKDKLLIHFLRARNGGGEINSVTIVKTTPISALITFEDSGVAQRVIQQSPHLLDVDGKKYKVVVTENSESLDPDKVILRLSAIVDYSQLPGGFLALSSLHKSHPDIKISSDATKELCTLHGTYSKVQAALAHLFGHPGGPQSAENKHSDQPATSGSRSVPIAHKLQTQESADLSSKLFKQREKREKVDIGRPSDDNNNSSSRKPLTPGVSGLENKDKTEGAVVQLPGYPTASGEDFSLILDADMFEYLKKHCRKEYQHILSRYSVDVVDMTNHGLTTLFLKVATGVGEGDKDQKRLKLAIQAISRLYQENETKIRRGQLSKNILPPSGGLQKAMENLSVRFPKLLLKEDDQNIYIIGSCSDVAEAKQFLLLDPIEAMGKKENVASLLKYPSYSGSSTHADELKVPVMLSSTVESLDDRLELLRSEEDERRAEGARKYKLAARFKDSGLASLGSRQTDFNLRGLSSPSRQPRLGPMLGQDVLSQTAGISGETVSRASAQTTGEDILFKSEDALTSPASMQNKASLNLHSVDTPPKYLTPLLGTTSLSEGCPLPPAGSGSTLKRASSFSGTPQLKAQVIGHKRESQDDSTVRARGRSSSFSNKTGRDKLEVYKEITVSNVMWKYIKEAYKTRVEDLTSDVLMKEICSGGSSYLTVTLRGANSSKVNSCLLGLQMLVDSVNVDFSVQQLRLSELGITDTADETLQACCAEVRSRFKKVTLQILKESLFLLGPKVLCSQVGASLLEVFTGDSAQISKQHDHFDSSTPDYNPSTFLQMNKDQSMSLHCDSYPQVMLKNQTGKANGTDSQERITNQRSYFCETDLVNGAISQPSLRKDPVIKEKVKIVRTLDIDGQQTETFVNHSKAANDKSFSHVNDVESTTTPADEDLDKQERTVHSKQKDSIQQRQSKIPDPEESRSNPEGCICVCGESEMLLKAKCGAAMCSKCLDIVHAHCRICHEQTSQGIQGNISYSKIYISLPGHTKDSAIKIAYTIPDGIQGETHPSPGEPFQGGNFEAYLPDSEKARKLVPRLKKAFNQGLTFTVTAKDTGARVDWDCIPHKTSIHGGKSGNGYPDSTYLTRLSEVLELNGIEEQPAKS